VRAADRRHIEVNISNRAGGRANHLMCCEVHRVTRGVTVPDILSCVCVRVCVWSTCVCGRDIPPCSRRYHSSCRSRVASLAASLHCRPPLITLDKCALAALGSGVDQSYDVVTC